MIRYLDRKLYREKYDFGIDLSLFKAYAHLISEEYQGALSIFLELRQLGFNDFELLESISHCYLKLKNEQKFMEMVKIMMMKYGDRKAEEIQKIEKQIKVTEIDEKFLQQYSNYYNEFKQCQLDQLPQWKLSKLCFISFILSDHKLFLDIFSRKFPGQENYEWLLIISNYLRHQYQVIIKSYTQNTYLKDDRSNFLIGFSYCQMKEYNKAMQFYQHEFDQNEQYQYIHEMYFIQLIAFNHSYYLKKNQHKYIKRNKITNVYNPFYNKIYLRQQQISQSFDIKYKTINQEIQNELLELLIRLLNYGDLLCCHYIFMLCYNNYKEPMRQQQMIDLMMKYNPNLAEAYQDQYLMSKQQNYPIDLNYLIERLLQCYDSICKFTSLALLQQDQGKFEEALLNL